MSSTPRIRLLLVEDQTLVRHSLRSVLEAHPHFELIGEASDGEEAVACVEELQPTVVIMDINMPRMDGVAATRAIKAQFPDVAIVGLTITAEGYHQSAMRRAGAFDVLSKGRTSLEQLYGTIETAAGR
ncbi:MAG TPA: response regulator [Nitrospira sp.]|nr:response regulator [Nitrospira sp.]